MTWHGLRRGALVAVLLGSAGCALAPRYGDTGPGQLVLVDARCTRSEDCTVVDAWDGDPCYCDAEWRAANVDFARQWSAARRGHNSLDSREHCAQCGATRPPPELAVCIDAQCVAIRAEEANPLYTRLLPYLSPPPAASCPQPPEAP